MAATRFGFLGSAILALSLVYACGSGDDDDDDGTGSGGEETGGEGGTGGETSSGGDSGGSGTGAEAGSGGEDASGGTGDTGGGTGGSGGTSGGTGGTPPTGGVAGMGGTPVDPCPVISTGCSIYCDAMAESDSCADRVASIDDCQCDCEMSLRGSLTCATAFDELIMCGGDPPTLECTGITLPTVVGCAPEREDLLDCLSGGGGTGGDCGTENPDCVTLCEALAAPGCDELPQPEACICHCQATMSEECVGLVEDLVDCANGGLAFACDGGLPVLDGNECDSEWTTLESTCF
jgi:hypothetical protein